MVKLLYRLATVVSFYFLKKDRSLLTFFLDDSILLYSDVFCLFFAILGKRGDLPWVSRMVDNLSSALFFDFFITFGV